VIVDRLDRVTDQVDRRLAENVRTMNESKSFLVERVSTTERAVQSVNAGLGKLQQITTDLQRTNQEIAHFQQLLEHPKVRGSFGEVLLSHMLADVLPQDHYELQYAFQGRNEIADAIIRLHDGYIVAVDAKFPLANYINSTQAPTDSERHAAERLFRRDVKKHITDIASKYISPRDRTLDFAFMYIPIEGVYYETMVHDPSHESLWEVSLENRVIPVSPNSFLAYLHTVLIGLRGMRVQEQAQEILRNLGQVRRDVGHFAEEFTVMGTHLSNAKNRYDDSVRTLDRVANRLEQVDRGVSAPTEHLS
jgi:DNA recombination protein RmuC